MRRGGSLRRSSRSEIDKAAAERAGTRVAIVTDGDLARLPTPVATYLRRAGVIGKPRVVDLHAVFRARRRTARDAAWSNRAFGDVRLAAFGTASWREPDGDVWTYAEFTLERIEDNGGAREWGAAFALKRPGSRRVASR